MVNHTLSRLRAPSPSQDRSLPQRGHQAFFVRVACVALLTLSLGLSAIGAHLLDTSATSFSHQLLTSHHLASPAPLAGGGCGATLSDC